MLRITRITAAALAPTAALITALAACGGDQTSRNAPPTHTPVVVTPVAPVSEPTGPTVDPNVSFEEAESTFTARRYGEATEMFAAYTARRPDNPWGYYMLGLSAWKSGQLDRARGALESALTIDPSHVKGLVNLSRVLLDLERPTEALERARQAVALDSTNGDAHRVLGRVHGTLGNVDDAIAAYRSALVVDPYDRWSMNNMGLVLIRAGRYEEALFPLARAVQLDEENVPQFLNNLAIALERTGHVEEAAAQYAKVLEVDSGYVKAKASLARVSGRRNEPGLEPVQLSTLGDAFSRTVAEWQRVRSEVAGEVGEAGEVQRTASQPDSSTTPR